MFGNPQLFYGTIFSHINTNIVIRVCLHIRSLLGVMKYLTVLSADLLNVFEVFIPQLLLYPNPSDPLNGDAASLMMNDQKQYEQKVKGEICIFC